MNKKILLFQLKGDRKKQACRITRELGFEPVIVLRGMYNETLGYIAGREFSKPSGQFASGADLPGEMVVFSDLSSDDLDKFLDAWKATGFEKIEYKAVITPTTVNWTPYMLYEELTKEIQTNQRG